MSGQAFTKNPFSQRKFLQSSVLPLACGLVGAPLQAVGQAMKPMTKRMPTAAESKAVRDYHAKSHGYLFEEDFRDRAAFDSRWTVYQDNRSDLLACRTAKSRALSADGLSINTVNADHCTAKWSTGETPSVRPHCLVPQHGDTSKSCAICSVLGPTATPWSRRSATHHCIGQRATEISKRSKSLLKQALTQGWRTTKVDFRSTLRINMAKALMCHI